MNNKQAFVIWGSSGHAKVLNDSIEKVGGHVVAMFDNKITNSVIHNVPIFYGIDGFKHWVRLTRNIADIKGLVAIGGNRGRDRLIIMKMMSDLGVEPATIIDPTANKSRSSKIGLGCQMLPGSVLAADAVVGAGCILNHRSILDHESTIGQGTHLAPGSTVCGLVTIGENVLVGAGSVVLPRITVGNDVLIGAGAVVTRNVPDGATVAGIPARVVRN